MSYITEKVAYLRGLADGLKLGDSAQDKLLFAIIDTLEVMADAVEENEIAIEELDDSIQDIYDEFDCWDDDFEDDELDLFDEDSFIEKKCPNCHETIYFDHDMLDGSKSYLLCPNCNAAVEVEE